MRLPSLNPERRQLRYLSIAITGGSIALLVSYSIDLRAQAVKTPPITELYKETETALLKVRITDKTSVDAAGDEFPPEQKAAADVAVAWAKKAGSIEKNDLMKRLASQNITSIWNSTGGKSRSEKDPSKVYSKEALGSISSIDIKSTYPLLLRKIDSGRSIKGNQIVSSPPGATRTIPRASGGETIIDLKAITPDSYYGSALISRAKKQDALGSDVSPSLVLVPNIPPRPTAPVYEVFLRVPVDQVQSVLSVINPENIPGAVTVVANPKDLIEITPATGDNSEGYELNETEKKFLINKFSTNPINAGKKRPVLIIVDDGFPSQKAWDDSREFFTEAVQSVMRDHYADARWLGNFQRVPNSGVEPATLAGPRGLKGCEGGAENPECVFHAKHLDQSLRIFRELVPPGREEPVRVVWLPFFDTQDGTFSQYEKIYRVAQAIPGAMSGGENAREYSAADFYNLEQDLIDAKKRILGSYPVQVNAWRTSTPLLMNLVHLAQWYSRAEGIPVFINISWTVATTIMGQRPQSGVYLTALVIAAGNTCPKEAACANYIDSDGDEKGNYEFLRSWAHYPNLYIIVTNSDFTGKAACGTALVRPEKGMFAYPGNINGACGTSLSAPRVAWLLAAREAYRQIDKNSQVDPGLWFSKLHKELFFDREETGCDAPHQMGCALFDVRKQLK